MTHSSTFTAARKSYAWRLSIAFDGGDAVLFADAKLDTATLIPQFYANRDHAPAWYATLNTEQLFAELNRGLEQGFRPTDLNLPVLYELQDAEQSR
ncbi:hypothetical protein [Roseovarius gaetbuli]|uniref:hypothetical protein n=1 Tax=Roseovarius gaetbuli TaxID=1356575 RepID=UPI00111C30B8|nr:hypothetical protein [Roseovarius gaetbuli]